MINLEVLSTRGYSIWNLNFLSLKEENEFSHKFSFSNFKKIFFSLKKFVITERYVKKSSIMSRPRNVTRIGLFLSQENDRMGKVINEACNDALPAESGSCPYNRSSLDYRRQFESTCCRNFEERSGLIRRSFHGARETNQV